MKSATPIIQLEDVSKAYRQGAEQIRAVDRVSFHVTQGEFVAIMGPSGSGKSTLLNLIGGLDVPDSGSISIAGRTLAGMSDDELTLLRRRKVGFIFQFFNLLTTLTAKENVALPLAMDGRPAREIEQRVEALLKHVGLWERRNHPPDALSGGEMQRVAIARALVIDPVLLLADEPTGNLDSATGEDILKLMKTTTEGGQTIVMVTHDARSADYGTRVVTLKDGRIVTDLNRS